jgi:hypothetical protein
MRTTIAAIACFLSLAVQAQYADLQTGFSFASGSFGNNKLSKAEDGFATNGFTSGLQVAYLVHKNIGICAKVNYSTFGIDESAYTEQLNAGLSQGTSVAVKSNDDYKSTMAMAGPYLSLGKTNFTFDIRLMTGFLSLNNPGYTFTTTYGNQQYTERTTSERDAAIAFGWGLTAKYAFPKNIYLSLNMDNVYANTAFNRNGYNSSNDDKVDKPYESYMLTLGIGYALQ